MKRLLSCLAAGMLTVGASAQWVNAGDDLPAYHAAPPAPAVELPPILSGSRLASPHFLYPWQKVVYQDAARVSKVLYQLPCFCRCDRGLGHTSLRSCFEGLHGAECSTCAKEGYYAYKMTKQGKSVKEIREGIVRRDFQNIDLTSIHTETAGR